MSLCLNKLSDVLLRIIHENILKPDSSKPEILFTGNWHFGLFIQLINLGPANSKVRQLPYINVLGF